MIVQNRQVVEIDFTITDDTGTLLEETEAGKPFSFLEGNGDLLPGIEDALRGRRIGEEIDLHLPPDQAFGLVNPELRKVVSKKELDQYEAPPEPGESIVLDDYDPIPWTVYKVEDDLVYIDGNHPYAGKSLTFWIKIVGIKALPDTRLQTGQNEDKSLPGCGPGCCC